MRTRSLRLAIFASLILIGFLLVQAPARLITAFAGQGMYWSGVSGTVWEGRLASLQVQSPWGQWRLGEVSWRLKPWSLLLFRPQLDVAAAWRGQQVSGTVSVRPGSGLTITDSRAVLPAELARLWFPVTVGGEVSFASEHMEIEGAQLTRGHALVTWRSADWTAVETPIPLGDYEARVQARDGSIESTVRTLSGPISVSGNAAWSMESYSIDLLLRGQNGGLPPSLGNALSLVAVEEDGGFRVRF